MFNTLLHLSGCNILGFSTPFTAPASEVPQEDAHFSAQACTSYNHDDYTQYIRQPGIPQQFKQRESCAEYHGKKKIMSGRLTKPLSSLLAIPWWFSGLKLRLKEFKTLNQTPRKVVKESSLPWQQGVGLWGLSSALTILTGINIKKTTICGRAIIYLHPWTPLLVLVFATKPKAKSNFE